MHLSIFSKQKCATLNRDDIYQSYTLLVQEAMRVSSM